MATAWGQVCSQCLLQPPPGYRPTGEPIPHRLSNAYWLVAGDGGVFAFGGGRYWGSMAGNRLNSPMVGIAVDYLGDGY